MLPIDQQCQVAIPPTRSAEISTATKPAPPNRVPTSTDATNPAAMEHIPPLTTTQSLLTHLIKDANVVSYLENKTAITPVNVDRLETELFNYPFEPFVTHLLQGFRFGFRIGYDGPRQFRFSKNLKSATSLPDVIERNLLKEVSVGRTAGPFCSPPFTNFQIYPIGVVPKKHSNEWRTIFHLSHPKQSDNSVNANIPKEDYSLQYVRIDDAINMLTKLGKGAFMAKTDIRSAFRNVPVHPNDWELLGMQWNGFFYFDKVLPFGLRSAPHIFNQLSDAIEWIMSNNYSVDNILHILDDFFIAEAPPRRHCMTSLCKLLCLLADLNIPVAPRKTFPASTTLEFLGIRLDSDNMTASLPEDKYERLKVDLSSWLTKKFCTLKELQSLIGTLQFACRVVVPGRPFLQRIIALTRGVARFSHHIKLNTSFRKDIAMWQIFLDHWNGSNFFLESKTTQSPDIPLFTDASGSLG